MNETPCITCLIEDFGREGSEEIEGDLAEIHHEEKSGEDEDGRAKGLTPAPEEGDEEERKEKKPVAFEEGIDGDGMEDSWLPAEFEC